MVRTAVNPEGLPIQVFAKESLTSRKENMLEIGQNTEVRDAIITVLSDVGCREGVRENEISKVLAIGGVSESAFNEQWQSEDDLVSAFLKDRHAIWMRWFEDEIEARYQAAGGGLEIIADVLQAGFEESKRFGFAFIHIVTEGTDFDNGAVVIASAQREHLRWFIEQLAAKMGIQHPDMAASAAVLVIERTIVRTLMTGSLKEAKTARLLFQCLQHA